MPQAISNGECELVRLRTISQDDALSLGPFADSTGLDQPEDVPLHQERIERAMWSDF